jgi:uncharacterized protein YdaU (DUF1376 family)
MTDPIPYWRFFVGGFAAETQHLSAAQLGHHVRLLMLAWRRASCSIPNEAEWISRRLGVGPDDYSREVVPVLSDLWESDGDDLTNADLRSERLHVEERSEKARKAANARYRRSNVHPLNVKEK